MALLYVILKSISKGIVQTPVFYGTGVVLGILLIIQFSLMVGAIQAKSAADAAEIYMHQILEGYSGVVGSQDSQRVLDAVKQEYPIIGSYLGVCDFSGTTIVELPGVMHDKMIDFLNSYIWHRIWWILGMVIVACVLSMFFSENRNGNANIRTRRPSAPSRRHYDDF